MARYTLPAPTVVPVSGLRDRIRTYLFRTVAGRILLGCLAVFALGKAGVPLPGFVSVPVRLLLIVFGLYGGFRLLRIVAHRLVWRIRTKLILSYLFIAVVPVVLLLALFLLTGALFSGLIASHLVSSEVERKAEELQAAARGALSRLPLEDAPSVLSERLAPGRAIHPEMTWTLVRHGEAVAASGPVAPAVPGWWKGPGFAGLVMDGESESLRAAWADKNAVLILDVPIDSRLLAGLERRTGIQLLATGGRTEARGEGVSIEFKDEQGHEERHDERVAESREISGMPFIATPDRTDWKTGKQELGALAFHFRPYDLIRRLSPSTLNTADMLVKLLAFVGVIFLFMYSFALLLGLLLARSITRSVHALSQGTERLRQGDFSHPIQVRSRDQLGELAESFNLMSRGIAELLRQQVEKERLEEELRIARQIQMSLLPPQGVATLLGLRISALCLPAAEVGGDYYDLLPLSDTRMGVLVADVSGKGTSAALYMAELKGLVLSLSRIYESPAKLLAEANRILAVHMDSRSFITMTYAVVDTAARTMRYARAGHNPIIQFETGTGRTRVLTPQGLGLGIDRGDLFEQILEEAEVPLKSGDIFLFFTDGLSEAMNSQAELFGERRLRQIIEESEGLGSDEIKERILGDIRSFVGDAAQHDDMTLVILKVA